MPAAERVAVPFDGVDLRGTGSEIGRFAWFCAPSRYAARLPLASVTYLSQSDLPVDMTT